MQIIIQLKEKTFGLPFRAIYYGLCCIVWSVKYSRDRLFCVELLAVIINVLQTRESNCNEDSLSLTDSHILSNRKDNVSGEETWVSNHLYWQQRDGPGFKNFIFEDLWPAEVLDLAKGQSS